MQAAADRFVSGRQEDRFNQDVRQLAARAEAAARGGDEGVARKQITLLYAKLNEGASNDWKLTKESREALATAGTAFTEMLGPVPGIGNVKVAFDKALKKSTRKIADAVRGFRQVFPNDQRFKETLDKLVEGFERVELKASAELLPWLPGLLKKNGHRSLSSPMRRILERFVTHAHSLLTHELAEYRPRGYRDFKQLSALRDKTLKAIYDKATVRGVERNLDKYVSVLLKTAEKMPTGQTPTPPKENDELLDEIKNVASVTQPGVALTNLERLKQAFSFFKTDEPFTKSLAREAWLNTVRALARALHEPVDEAFEGEVRSVFSKWKWGMNKDALSGLLSGTMTKLSQVINSLESEPRPSIRRAPVESEPEESVDELMQDALGLIAWLYNDFYAQFEPLGREKGGEALFRPLAQGPMVETLKGTFVRLGRVLRAVERQLSVGDARLPVIKEQLRLCSQLKLGVLDKAHEYEETDEGKAELYKVIMESIEKLFELTRNESLFGESQESVETAEAVESPEGLSLSELSGRVQGMHLSFDEIIDNLKGFSDKAAARALFDQKGLYQELQVKVDNLILLLGEYERRLPEGAKYQAREARQILEAFRDMALAEPLYNVDIAQVLKQIENFDVSQLDQLFAELFEVEEEELELQGEEQEPRVKLREVASDVQDIIDDLRSLAAATDDEVDFWFGQFTDFDENLELTRLTLETVEIQNDDLRRLRGVVGSALKRLAGAVRTYRESFQDEDAKQELKAFAETFALDDLNAFVDKATRITEV